MTIQWQRHKHCGYIEKKMRSLGMSSATAKKLPSLHAYKANKGNAFQNKNSFLILEKWEMLLSNGDSFPAIDALATDNEELHSVQQQLEGDYREFRTLLTEEMMSREVPWEKEQLVHSNQLQLVRLIDTVYRFMEKAQLQLSKEFYEATIKILLEALRFLEEFFPSLLDENCPVPQSYILQIKVEWLEKLGQLEGNTSEETRFLAEIIRHFIKGIHTNVPVLTYRELRYIASLLAEISILRLPSKNATLKDRLYYLNFNEESFVFSEFERFDQLIQNKANKNEKIAALRMEQKYINQLPVKLNFVWSLSMPSLKDQINGWINEEINFLESVQFPTSVQNGSPENTDKIQTSLSVAKLAVIIRLLVIDKIIINRAVAPMLRIVTKVFATIQKDEISFGSLETKYHAPDKATIIAVRDLLFKWINILAKLEKQF